MFAQFCLLKQFKHSIKKTAKTTIIHTTLLLAQTMLDTYSTM